MKNIEDYIDSTYLKTNEQSGLSEGETRKIVFNLTKEALENGYYAVMIRPQYVREIKDYITSHNGKVKVGTVIDFPQGTASTENKIIEAEEAIGDGADELDFVANYQAFKKGNLERVKEEILKCTRLGLINQKIVKWIIEIAALTDQQIAEFTRLIADVVEANFPDEAKKVFVKSSTGFYKTEAGKPAGATFEGMKIILDNVRSLSVKAAGGIRTPEEAQKMIEMGVGRIGTSSAKSLIENQQTDTDY